MPQLDVATFPSQIFWFFVTFFLLCFCMHYLILPSIKKCLKERRYFIDSICAAHLHSTKQLDLQRAKYLNAINNAKSVAEDIVKDTDLWIENYHNEVIDKLNQKIERMLQESEENISALKNNSKAEMMEIAFKVAIMYNIKVVSTPLNEEEMKIQLHSFIKNIITGN